MLFYTYKCQRFFILLSLGFAEGFNRLSAFFFGKAYPSFFQVFGISEPFKIAMKPCNYLKPYMSVPTLSDY